MTNMLNTLANYQIKIIESIFENAKNMPQTVINPFTLPTETFNKSWMNSESVRSIYENNIKFHTAYINYNKAVIEMYKAIYSNIELINKETIK